MKSTAILYHPVEGKTYSLFGDSNSTADYYATINSLTNKILEKYDPISVLEALGKYSPKKRYLKRIASGHSGASLISFCLNTVHNALKPFTKRTNAHLKNLPLSKLWDRRLATTEEQYHLYMLEIELTNRLNQHSFLLADRRISLQPYCLQDFSANCRAAESGFDYQCKYCSENCYQHYVSKLLKENNIEPYIWMGASIRKAVREAQRNSQTIGILGIACIPELVWGIRKCMKYQIPVVGIPLNANRCVRWFGEFHQNSVDLNALEKLIRKI
jgi:hypothetical protein